MELAPVYLSHNVAGWVHLHLGDLERSRIETDLALELSGRLPVVVANRAEIHFRLGELDDCRRAIEELRRRGNAEIAMPLLVHLGELDLAVEITETGMSARATPWFAYMALPPGAHLLHCEPYLDVMRRFGHGEYVRSRQEFNRRFP